MWSSFFSLSAAPWFLFALQSWNMDAVPIVTSPPTPSQVAVEIRDNANLFSPSAEREARDALQHRFGPQRVPVLIETIESLDGAWVADIAQERARLAGHQQLYILVSGSEWDVGVIAAQDGPATRLTNSQRESIRQAFLGPLQFGWADVSLRKGVQAIGMTSASSAEVSPALNLRAALVCVIILLAAFLVGADSRTLKRYRARRRRLSSAGVNAARLGEFSSSASFTSSQVTQAPSASASPMNSVRSFARTCSPGCSPLADSGLHPPLGSPRFPTSNTSRASRTARPPMTSVVASTGSTPSVWN